MVLQVKRHILSKSALATLPLVWPSDERHFVTDIAVSEADSLLFESYFGSHKNWYQNYTTAVSIPTLPYASSNRT